MEKIKFVVDNSNQDLREYYEGDYLAEYTTRSLNEFELVLGTIPKELSEAERFQRALEALNNKRIKDLTDAKIERVNGVDRLAKDNVIYAVRAFNKDGMKGGKTLRYLRYYRDKMHKEHGVDKSSSEYNVTIEYDTSVSRRECPSDMFLEALHEATDITVYKRLLEEDYLLLPVLEKGLTLSARLGKLAQACKYINRLQEVKALKVSLKESKNQATALYAKLVDMTNKYNKVCDKLEMSKEAIPSIEDCARKGKRPQKGWEEVLSDIILEFDEGDKIYVAELVRRLSKRGYSVSNKTVASRYKKLKSLSKSNIDI